MSTTILSCAVTGTFTTREHNAKLPVTPQEIATACIDAANAGAAICHIHVRDPVSGKPSMNLDYYRDVVDQIRASGTDMIINLTTGPGARFVPSESDATVAAPESLIASPEERTRHVLELKPEICTLDLNTMWFGGGAVINKPDTVRRMAELIYSAGVKPEFEIFDSGDLQLAVDLFADGSLKNPALFQIVTGIKYGFSAGTDTLQYISQRLPADCQWAAFGASRHAFRMLAQAYLLGGHCRIGMEDTVYISQGVKCESNAQLVEKAVNIIELLGGTIASPAQARKLLGITT